MGKQVKDSAGVWVEQIMIHPESPSQGGGSSGGSTTIDTSTLAKESKQTSMIGLLTSLLEELQQKADLTESQPVSLPATAASVAKQDSIITELQTIKTANRANAKFTPTYEVVTSSGQTPGDVFEVSITNLGSASGTVGTSQFLVGSTVTFRSPTLTSTIDPISFDAGGTSFAITTLKLVSA